MKRKAFCTLSSILAILAAGCQPAKRTQTSNPQAPADKPAATAKADDPQQMLLAAKDDLFKQLSTRLILAMSSGGPAAAIDVCSREAPRIAAEVGEQHGVSIGRTSFKLRNQQNAPPAWAQALVAEKADQAQFIELPNGRTGALLPIKLKAQCLACHGPSEQLADDVKAKLAKLYPNDQATGFQEGDLRGWFWVVVPAETADGASNDARSQPVGIDTESGSGQ